MFEKMAKNKATVNYTASVVGLESLLMTNVVNAAETLVESYRHEDLEDGKIKLLAKEIAVLKDAGFF